MRDLIGKHFTRHQFLLLTASGILSGKFTLSVIWKVNAYVNKYFRCIEDVCRKIFLGLQGLSKLLAVIIGGNRKVWDFFTGVRLYSNFGSFIKNLLVYCFKQNAIFLTKFLLFQLFLLL